MTDLTEIVSSRNEEGERTAYLGEASFGSIDALVAEVPELLEPDAATELARHVNNFARGSDYVLIEDPSEFAERYRAQLESEDPSQPWREGVMRLSDFGVPNFDEITAPRHDGETLVYFAEDRATGLAYRASASLSGLAEPSYEPVPLDDYEPAE